MASDPVLSASNLLALANNQFGTKQTVLYYIRKGNAAAGRAKVAASIPNAVMMGAEIQTMAECFDTILLLLNDDKAALPQEK